jgi:hypothetical protein
MANENGLTSALAAKAIQGAPQQAPGDASLVLVAALIRTLVDRGTLAEGDVAALLADARTAAEGIQPIGHRRDGVNAVLGKLKP